MSKLTSLIRRAPKRFSAVAIMVAAAIIVPAVAFAWGPNRPTYTAQNPAPHVTFNSMTDNPQVGDERNFVRIREDGTSNNYGDNVTLQPGKVYEVMVFYHNNAASNLNASGKGIAHDTKLRMELPGVVKPGVNAVLAGNISASNATPQTVWDEAYGKNATNGDIALRYLSGSATVASSNGAVKGQKLPDSLFTTGTHLGYDSLNGELPGCNEYSGYVTFKFRVDQPNFTIKKEVSTDGKTWVDGTTKATAGSTVQYRLTYQNTGSTQQDNVSLRDMLPAGVTYVPGSSLIANSTTGGQYKETKDGVTTTGYNAGSYQPRGNVYFKFSAKVAKESELKCGTNTLKNVVRATTNAGYKEDDATITVDRTCKPEAKYTCDSLSVKQLTPTSFRFTTDYSVSNATFKSVTYTIRNANGTVVDTKTATSKTLDYTRTQAGAYSVQAAVTFVVDGVEKTVSSENCKKSFEVKSVKYTCDSLAITTISTNKFRFTIGYTAENATFKNVQYVIKNANGDIVDTKSSTSRTLDYETATPGTYSVVATIAFTVNGDEQKVTSANCKGTFEVPKTPGDITVCEVATKKIITIKENEFDSAKHSKNLDDCKDTPVTPPETPETPETPPELPQTGAGDGIVALVGLGALIASAAYYIASRRALGL